MWTSAKLKKIIARQKAREEQAMKTEQTSKEKIDMTSSTEKDEHLISKGKTPKTNDKIDKTKKTKKK